MEFDWKREYYYRGELLPLSAHNPPGSQFVLLHFEKAVTCPLDSVVIGSRLDTDTHSTSCRLAFAGRVLQDIDFDNEKVRERVKIARFKERVGTVDRVVDDRTVIGRDLFKKETDLSAFIGLTVHLQPSGIVGRIESPFGKTGKFKAVFPAGLPIPDQKDQKSTTSDASVPSKRRALPRRTLQSRIVLRLKKYVFAVNRKAFVQS